MCQGKDKYMTERIGVQSGSRVGQHLGNYVLLQSLGEGGFAEVYLGEHIYLKTQAAIKILKFQIAAEDLQAFLTEAQTIAHLKHPHIVRVLEFGVQDQLPFLVMEYAPNGALRSRLPAQPLPPEQVIPYITQIASALHYAHEQHIIHRDIKPDNMLIGTNEEILLSDFGIASRGSANGTLGALQTQDATGTPAYMAPEQFRGKPQPASDQYALAIVAYEWLCGRRPFDGDMNTLNYQHTHAAPPSPRSIVPLLSPALEQVLLKALAKDPQQRYPSVLTFAEALEQATSTLVPMPNTHTDEACFICTFLQAGTYTEKQALCTEKHIQGRIFLAQERNIEGKPTPYIMIDQGTTRSRVAFAPEYYGEFVRELLAQSNKASELTLHIYHLPTPLAVTEYKGKPLYHYVANPYTLAMLEPDTLLNITDLSQADYCYRKYLLNRLIASPPSVATIRGNLIHKCFTALLKQSDQRHVTEQHGQTALEILNSHFETALSVSKMDMALANISEAAMRIDVQPHLESLATWYEHNRISLWGSDSSVRAETFLLVPEIGLRGRLDLYWQQSVNQSLLELKTGGASGILPKSDHRQQVHGYQALLAVRQNPTLQKAKANLLYSGTPGQASMHELRLDYKGLQKINRIRNMLVLSHTTGTPSAPPGASKCTKCSMLHQCERVSTLLDWQLPQPQQPNTDVVGARFIAPASPAVELSTLLIPKIIDSPADREFFSHYYQLLHLEGRAGEQTLGRLWKRTVQERVDEGKTIHELQAIGAATLENGGWSQTFTCNNQSELREGDEILLSNGDPIKGEVVTGTITKISAKQVTVWTRECIDKPTLLDSYDNDLVHVRTLQNLLRWLDADLHLRDLVAGRVRPRFLGVEVPKRVDFNAEQNEAVERAVQMQDYVLIQGPPGTGKTSVIAEIVKRLTQQGQRVLLAAFTNQAVDNMLKRLIHEGFTDFVRLGHERSVNDSIAPYLLQRQVEQQLPLHSEQISGQETDQAEQHNPVYTLLQTTPVVASTTATWSSDRYSPTTGETHSTTPLHFDVAIIDEASQLTIPALLGALRFVKRFILVGDEQQLPPLVLSKEAAAQGLSNSLFSFLNTLHNGYINNHPLSTNPSVRISPIVKLKTQYRMNKWISNFSSTVFYERALVADKSVADRRLEVAPTVISKVTEHITRNIETPQQENSIPEAVCITQAIAPDHPLVFVDVRGEVDKGIMKTSDAEARAVRDIVAGLLTRGVNTHDIGVIAPYRAQVANIRRHLLSSIPEQHWAGLTPETLPTVDTVDRFQGGERRVILMSFATTSAPQGERLDFLTNPNRLNVALTRAQRKLILVGCVPVLENLNIFERLVRYCRSMKTVIPYHIT